MSFLVSEIESINNFEDLLTFWGGRGLANKLHRDRASTKFILTRLKNTTRPDGQNARKLVPNSFDNPVIAQGLTEEDLSLNDPNSGWVEGLDGT